MKQYFLDLFKYDSWANQAVYNSIVNTKDINEKAPSLFSHIVASQKIWLSRVTNKEDNPISPWEQLTLEDGLLLSRQIREEWVRFIEESSNEKFKSQIVYTNSQGKTYKNYIIDIIIHVINHSTYHRGQIASLVRAGGGIPAVTDYIFYKRE